jgi:serine phosphatase RsbU (regulator of sigma subunit)/Tfp pilus assembly protein PilF
MTIADLEKKLAAATQPSERIAALHDLGYALRYSYPVRTVELGNEALALSSQPAQVAQSHRIVGIGKVVLGYFDEAAEHLNRALEHFTAIGDKAGMMATTANLGACFQRAGKFEIAIDYHMKALPIAEELGDRLVLSNTLYNIGKLFVSLNQTEDAEPFLRRATKIKEEDADGYGVAMCLELLGYILEKKGDFAGAVEYYEVALRYARDCGDRGALPPILRGLGRMNLKTRRLEQALEYFDEAMRLLNDIGDRAAICETLIETAELYRELGSFEPAVKVAQKSLGFAEGIGVGPEVFQKAYLALSKAHEAAGNYESALEAYKKFAEIQASVLQIAGSQRIAALQAKFELEKSEKEKQLFQLKNIELASALKELRTKTKLIEENYKDMLSSIHYAQRIQEAILPRVEEVQAHFSEAFIYYKPKDVVSGDFYWVKEQGGIVLFAAVDCTGHGVPAALMSIIGINLLNEITGSKAIREPARVLGQMHNGVRTLLKQDNPSTASRLDGMDVVLCAFDKTTRELQYAGAFNPLYVSRRDGVEEIRADRLPIGGLQDEMFRIYTNHRITLSGHEILYLTSDGFANQIGGDKGKRYTGKRFKEFLETLFHVPMPEQPARIEEEFHRWRGNYEQLDDLLVMGVRV